MPLEDSEQGCGVKSVFREDFSLAVTDKLDTQGERGRMGRQGLGQLAGNGECSSCTLRPKCSEWDCLEEPQTGNSLNARHQ